jgi:hypothetical protein
VIRIARAVLPGGVRRFLRARHRAFVFRRAMRALRAAVARGTAPPPEVVRGLIYGWGNEQWSAREDYLAACLAAALAARGPILECGTGLTTVVLGVVAQRTGNAVWALEHRGEWGARVETHLRRYGGDAVRVSTGPLKAYAGYDWYDPPVGAMPEAFALVVCDGPPGATRGGRYGLVPVMRARLPPGCVILLDDARRGGERAVAARWSADLGVPYETLGSAAPYIRIVVGPQPALSGPG